jgi:hypothetical protein
MIACIAASFAVFWWAGELLSIPRHRGFNASLLRQPSGHAVIAVIAAFALVLGTAFIAGIVARRFWLLAGPLAALAGLSAWSFRGGPGYYAFLSTSIVSNGTGVFYLLAAECLLYGVLLAVLWSMVYRLFRDPAAQKASPFTLRPTGDAVQVVLTQAAFTILGTILFVPSSDKGQAVFGLFTASFLAAGLTRYFHGGRTPSQWIWAAPILAGIFGYIANGMGDGAKLAIETGRLSGAFAALARPLPLDYTSAGVVGALVGLALTTHEWELGTRLSATRQPQS